jgi:hypothetical protein
MSVVVRLLAGLSLLSAVALGAGCSDTCSSAQDCAQGEVCFREVCTPSLSSNLSCVSDADCNGDGPRVFECAAARCRILPSGGAFVPDAGTSTTTDAGP